jgi:hypothetical protein
MDFSKHSTDWNEGPPIGFVAVCPINSTTTGVGKAFFVLEVGELDVSLGVYLGVKVLVRSRITS